MKRVLHVLNSLQRSGMEMMLLNSAEEWRRHGYECDVLATANAVGPIAVEMRESGFGVFHIPFRSNHRYLPRLKFIGEFYRLCKSGYDVVHIHTESGRPVFAVLAKLAGVRRIAVTPHGMFKFEGALRVRKLCERHLIRLLGGRFGMISEGVRKCEWERFRIEGPRISNWLDTAHFRPPSAGERAAARRSLGIGDEEFAVVSVGNCSPVKNHQAVLRAIAMVPATMSPLYLHIGREEPDFPERKLVSLLGVDNKVRFLGSQPELLPFLWAADVFVMPSLHEGFGIAALEAVAAGVPLVCSHVEGLSDVAAETRWAVRTSTSPESIAEGLMKVATLEQSERRQSALTDSNSIRKKFAAVNGVRTIVEGLYA